MILATTGPAPAPVEDKRTPDEIAEIFRAKSDLFLQDETLHPDVRELLEKLKEAGKPQPEGAK